MTLPEQAERIMISRSYAASLNNIGALHHERGDVDQAMRYYRRALAERISSLSAVHSTSGSFQEENCRCGCPRRQRAGKRKRYDGEAEAEAEVQTLASKRTQLLEATDEERRLERAQRQHSLMMAGDEAVESVEVPSSPSGSSPRLLDIYNPPEEGQQRFAYSGAILIRCGGGLPPGDGEISSAARSSDMEYSAVALHNLGLLHCHIGDFDGAIELFETCLAAAAEALCSAGDVRPDLVPSARNCIGQALLERGSAEESVGHLWAAVQSDEDELRRLRRLRRPDSPTSSSSSSAVDERRAVDAAIASAQIRLGRAHSNLGRAHFLLSDHDRALHHAKAALRHRIDALGVHHVDVAATLCSIGVIYREMGEWDEALDHVRWFVHQAATWQPQHSQGSGDDSHDGELPRHPQVRAALRLVVEIQMERDMFGGERSKAGAPAA